MFGLILLAILIAFGDSTVIHKSPKYDCLPNDVRPDEVVSYGRNAKENVTVVKKLDELKARCRKGRLLDSNKKEIRFFRVSCWGKPPPDYLEIKRNEKAEFEKLKKDYTVITIGCNPRTP